MIHILKETMLEKLPSIGHAFFTREGGLSNGRYASLNCSLTNDDSVENIIGNRRLAMEKIGFSLIVIAANNKETDMSRKGRKHGILPKTLYFVSCKIL